MYQSTVGIRYCCSEESSCPDEQHYITCAHRFFDIKSLLIFSYSNDKRLHAMTSINTTRNTLRVCLMNTFQYPIQRSRKIKKTYSMQRKNILQRNTIQLKLGFNSSCFLLNFSFSSRNSLRGF